MPSCRSRWPFLGLPQPALTWVTRSPQLNRCVKGSGQHILRSWPGYEGLEWGLNPFQLQLGYCQAPEEERGWVGVQTWLVALITPASVAQGWARPYFLSHDITADFVPSVLFQVPFFVAALSLGVQCLPWMVGTLWDLSGTSGETVNHRSWVKWGVINTTHTLNMSF